MYPRQTQINWVSVRIALIAVLFAAGTVVLLVRAYQLQVADAESLKRRADKQLNRVIH